jgi:hypothetical protein
MGYFDALERFLNSGFEIPPGGSSNRPNFTSFQSDHFQVCAKSSVIL